MTRKEVAPVKCPHMGVCIQKLVKGSLSVCEGKRLGFDFDKCFKWHSLDAEGKYRAVLKRAEEWASVVAKADS